MDRYPGGQFPYSAFFWPALAAASAGEIGSSFAALFVGFSGDADGDHTPQEPEGATPSKIALELQAVRLRDFTVGQSGVPTLLCTPLALHGAAIADLAAGHSLVAALRDAGIGPLFMTDWRSASAEMRFLGIDEYLADLNVLVDGVGGLVDLIGLCQGGWMALVYAARFPAKVRKLVLVGAPIDTDLGVSRICTAAHSLPLSVFDELARLGDGRVLGRRALDLWEPALQANDALAALQIQPCEQPGKERLLERFRAWSNSTVDLPGAFFHQVVLWLFKENRLAQGRFTALGRTIDLADVRHPLFLLAADGDTVVPPEQLLAVRRLV